MGPLHFQAVRASGAAGPAIPTLKEHQAIGEIKGINCAIYVSGKVGEEEENLILRRVIESATRDPAVQQDKIKEIKVKHLPNGNFAVKITSQGAIPTIKVEKTMDDIDNELQKQLLPVAQEAYDFYNGKLKDVVDNLNTLFKGLGIIQARAKSPVSGANRLMRTLKATWGPPDGVNNRNEAVKNLWDAIGSRIVANQGSEAEMLQIVDILADSIRNGQLEIVRLNNLRGVGGKPYFTDAQINQIQQADAERIKNLTNKGVLLTSLQPIQIGNAERSGGSPFTSICAYVKHGDEVMGELQIIGPQVLKLANAEHIPYDAMINKDLYRELNDQGKKVMAPFFDPFLQAVRGLSTAQKTEYNEYLNQAYIQARKVERGEASPSDTVKLPKGFDTVLSVENILKIYEKYEDTKKTMKI